MTARRWGGRWAVLILVLAAIGTFYALDLGRFFSLDTIQARRAALLQWTQAHYAGAVASFIAIYAVQTALSLPGATVLTLVGGFLFNPVWGTLYVNIGATTGATAAFWVARYVLRDAVERRFGERIKPLQDGFARNGFSYLLTLRLIPLFPFFMVNLVAGLTRLRTGPYVLATAIGILPASFIYCNAGQELGTLDSLADVASPRVALALTLLGLLALVPIAYRRWKPSRPGPTSPS